MREKGNEALDWNSISPNNLATYLEGFYADVRRKDGVAYKKNSMKAGRSALQRQLFNCKRQINIITDSELAQANRILDGVLKERKRSSEESAVEHKSPISQKDCDKLQTYFEDTEESTDAVKLSFYVWFQLSLHFCLRGAEIQSQMHKKDLVFSKADDGAEIIALGTNFMSKNHQGGLAGSEFSSVGVIDNPKKVRVIAKKVKREDAME